MINFIKKFKLLLASLGILGTAYASTFFLGAIDVPIVEVPSIIKTQIDTKYAHRFQDKTTGNVIEVEITKAEYDLLAVRGAGKPTYPNANWIGSYGGKAIYATSVPSLLDYQFYKTQVDMSSSTTLKVMIKVPNKAEQEIDSNYVSDGKLTNTELNQLQK